MSFLGIIPPLPTEEDGQSLLPLSVLVGVSEESVGQQIQAAAGKVEITRRGICREQFTAHRKSAVVACLIGHFMSAQIFWSRHFITGKDVIQFVSGEYLSRNASVHINHAAPFMVLEVVWDTEVNTEGKGLQKVWHDLFEAIGESNTRIEEAWVLALSRDPCEHNAKRTPSLFDWIPIVGPLITCILLTIAQLLYYHGDEAGAEEWGGWRGRVVNFNAWLGRLIVQNTYNTAQEQEHPPAQGPYLAVCFRSTGETKYFPLRRDEYLLLPPQCLFGNVRPVPTNALFCSMK